MSDTPDKSVSEDLSQSDAKDLVDKHHWLRFFRNEFDKESDRAAVILTAAMLDETLKDLLEAHLVPCSSSDDPLFDGANAPIGTFSARIECSYRLGLISKNFAKCLHITRKIRNAFAHDVAGCKFTSHSVASRVRALRQATGAPESSGKEDLSDPRASFCYITGYFMWKIKQNMDKISQLSEDRSLCCNFKHEEQQKEA